MTSLHVICGLAPPPPPPPPIKNPGYAYATDMNMSVERREIANLPDHNTILHIFSPKY